MKAECVSLTQGKLDSKGVTGKLVELVKKAGPDCEADMTHKHKDLVEELKRVCSSVFDIHKKGANEPGLLKGAKKGDVDKLEADLAKAKDAMQATMTKINMHQQVAYRYRFGCPMYLG